MLSPLMSQLKAQRRRVASLGAAHQKMEVHPTPDLPTLTAQRNQQALVGLPDNFGRMAHQCPCLSPCNSPWRNGPKRQRTEYVPTEPGQCVCETIERVCHLVDILKISPRRTGPRGVT